MTTRMTRLLRHRWREARLPRDCLSAPLLSRLGEQVRVGEQGHSGEIRVFAEAGLPLSYLWRRAPLSQIIRERAITQFGKLRVWDTAHNNGVLIYLLLAERRIEVVADRGLSAEVSSEVWLGMVRRMSVAFKQGAFEAGLALAVDEISALLHQHFALAPGEANPNELPDQPFVG